MAPTVLASRPQHVGGARGRAPAPHDERADGRV